MVTIYYSLALYSDAAARAMRDKALEWASRHQLGDRFERAVALPEGLEIAFHFTGTNMLGTEQVVKAFMTDIERSERDRFVDQYFRDRHQGVSR